MTAKTSRFSRTQSCRSRGAIAVMTQTRAYVPNRTWSRRWSRNRALICVVDVEIMAMGYWLLAIGYPTDSGSRPIPNSPEPIASSSRVQDLSDPRLQIDNVRARGPVTSPGQADAQRPLQIDQLESRLGARVRGPRRRWRETGERRESRRWRRYERRADE